MRLRLTDQHPVERIAMQRGQSAQLRDGGFIQGERRDEMFFALLRDELCGRLRQGKFAETVFDGDFPERNGAQENLIVRVAYRGGKRGGQFGVPDTSQRNSQVSSRIFICLQTSAKRLPATGR